jgi:hypothetical protein
MQGSDQHQIPDVEGEAGQKGRGVGAGLIKYDAAQRHAQSIEQILRDKPPVDLE